jgi:hypothetical protein
VGFTITAFTELAKDLGYTQNETTARHLGESRGLDSYIAGFS